MPFPFFVVPKIVKKSLKRCFFIFQDVYFLVIELLGDCCSPVTEALEVTDIEALEGAASGHQKC
jgi:hypothetical protein